MLLERYSMGGAGRRWLRRRAQVVLQRSALIIAQLGGPNGQYRYGLVVPCLCDALFVQIIVET